MRKFLCALLVASACWTAFAQTTGNPAEIIAGEKAFWTAYVSGDTTALSKLLLPEFTSVEQFIWNRDQVLNFVKKFHAQCSLAPVSVSDPHVNFITADIATVVYHATESPTCGGRTMSGQTNISTVWLRRDDRWQMHLHTEYAIPPQ
jgi:hypothetical protein